MGKKKDPYLCYCIEASARKTGAKLTYVGITNNFKRRLRQHNQEIKGGASFTKRSKNWRPIFQVRGFETKQQALQFEWAMKHRRKRSNKGSVISRLRTLGYLFSLERWTRKAPLRKSLKLDILFRGKRAVLRAEAPALMTSGARVLCNKSKEEFIL